MTSGAYYNEIDPFAAEWLRRLILFGHIAPGEVDERSIEDVKPDDLRGFTQCHFFAGIGVWSHALRSAGWADTRPVWTGSCPCQPFSAAGKGGGFDDERHLWPAFLHLIRECRPDVILGEQVASKDGLAWLDLVQADLEGEGYASGALDTCAAGFGAPHIRQRLYWVGAQGLAHAGGPGQRTLTGERRRADSGSYAPSDASARGGLVALADADGVGPASQRGDLGEVSSLPERQGQPDFSPAVSGRGLEPGELADTDRQLDDGSRDAREGGRLEHPDGGAARSLADTDDTLGRADDTVGHDGDWNHAGRQEGPGDAAAGLGHGELADADGRQHRDGDVQLRGELGLQPQNRSPGGQGNRGTRPETAPAVGTCPVNGLWRDADWLFCRDGRWRPVEPGTFPLAHGATARVGRLRGYGNAINAAQAQGFVEAVMESLP